MRAQKHIRLVTTLQRIALNALTRPAITPLFAPLMRGRATIFVLHRFRDRDRGTPGHDPAVLRALLARLRKERYPLVSLEELFRRMTHRGSTVSRAVAFTLDDGYVDQTAVAGPVFAEFDCPATVFVTTDFVDGRLWLWWDRIEYLFQRTERTRLELELDGTVLRYDRDDVLSFAGAQHHFTERCKRVSEEEKHAAILRLQSAAGVELPESPPAGYAPMTWADVRAWEKRGLTFGPHAVTHPVLARTSDEQSRHEITESWMRLTREARAPLPVFCYPSGQAWEYGRREMATLRHLGFLGAVCGTPTYAHVRAFKRDPYGRFNVPRIGYPHDPRAVVQYVSGLERLKQIVRAGPS